MRSFDGEEDIFFDACDDIRPPMEPSSSDDCSTSDEGLASWNFEFELWARELMSVQDRRQIFLKLMGFDELMTRGMASSECQGRITTDSSCNDKEGIITGGSFVDSSFSENESASDGDRCIRDLDTGKRFMVHDGMLKEVGSDNMMTLQEFESLLGLSQSVQKFLQREYGHGPAREKKGSFSAKEKYLKSLWRSITRKTGAAGICSYNVHVKNFNTSRPFRTKVQLQKKCMELSAVYMGQEIQAHKGLIRIIKFSPSGWYLASGGEDCVVRVWQIRELETSPELYGLELKLRKVQNRPTAVMPKKAFNISETPLHEFHGHTSDVLDLTWSKSEFLLTSSKDKTIRMWKVGCDGCHAVFKHKDYVTCVQFNPVDERYFISGSIDGKARVWHVLEKRVVDWVDVRDIITALSYQPDGKGFIVGTIAGICRFYDQSGEGTQLDKQLHIQRKKKSAANQITGLQLSRGGSPRIVITSADSKIRVAEGSDIIQKFEAPRKSKALFSPSLTSDGRCLISAGLDSNIYIWNFDTLGRNTCKRTKSVRACELFFSEGVTALVPWPGVHQDTHTKPSLLPDRTVNTSTFHGDWECSSLLTCSFADGTRRCVTWPEEKFLPCSEYASTISAAWNMVIVTASCDGVIRSFHNYGLPVRL